MELQDRFKNQSKLIDASKIERSRFVVIGAGAIGSFFTATIAKMGAKEITAYDDDTIENHNISNQIYPFYAIGKPKVEALQAMAFDFGEAQIKTINGRWTPESAVDGDIIVVAVDDMDVRRAIWDHYKTRTYGLFLEGRMAAQVFKVYAIDSTNKEAQAFYETTLYPQSEAVPDRCGEKSIIYTVLQVSGQMLSQVKRYLMSEYRPTEVVYDCLKDNVTKRYHMEQKYDVIRAPDVEEEDEPIFHEDAI